MNILLVTLYESVIQSYITEKLEQFDSLAQPNLKKEFGSESN